MTLTIAERAVLALRSSANKIGVPVDRSRVPEGLLIGLNQCLDDGLLIWIDRTPVPHTGVAGILDIYVATDKGLAAIKG